MILGEGVGRDGTEHSNVLATPDEQKTLYQNSGAISPPLDPVSLAHLYEMSGALRSNIDAYSVNIDSFGHRFEPIIDLKNPESIEQVKLAMMQEAMLGLDPHGPTGSEPDLVDTDKVISMLDKLGGQYGDPAPDPGMVPEPSEQAVKNRVESIRREMIRERMTVERFFAFCTVDESFEKLRMKTRQDLETGGNAYWEVLRNKAGKIVQFNHVPGFSVRLMPQEHAVQEVHMPTRATIITPTLEPVMKRFRRYVQVAQGSMRGHQLVWFKEFGDQRVVILMALECFFGHCFFDEGEGSTAGE